MSEQNRTRDIKNKLTVTRGEEGWAEQVKEGERSNQGTCYI